MISESLAAYLALERQMIAFDDVGKEAAADAIRDQMDPIWRALSNEDIEFLNSRGAFEKQQQYPNNDAE